MSKRLVCFMPKRALTTNVFKSHSFDWWSSPDLYPLRALNQLRVPLVRDQLITKSIATDKPLSGFKLVDVGCGGGLLSEPLARLGASVIGLDSSEESLSVAQNHLIRYSPSLREKLQYHNKSIEQFAAECNDLVDAVVASEVVEHVQDLDSFFKNCAKVLKPHGLVVITTINQTLTAYVLDILLAEKVFRILPDGTHQYENFVSPTSLSLLLEENNLAVRSIQGMVYNPISGNWSWTKCVANNYALVAVKKP